MQKTLTRFEAYYEKALGVLLIIAIIIGAIILAIFTGDDHG